MFYVIEEKKADLHYMLYNSWGGAKDTLLYMTDDEIETVLDILEDCTDDDHMMTDIELNDFFWFDTDAIADWLGFNNFDEMIERGHQRCDLEIS